MDRIPMTPEGFEELEKKLNEALARREEIIVAIQEARAHGDLSENAEYDAAKFEQAKNEKCIEECKTTLLLAQVITNEQLTGETATFGACVTLHDDETEEKVCYKIVGKFEADVKKGKISIESPLAKAIIGKKVGDWVHVITPKGEKSYVIHEISYLALTSTGKSTGKSAGSTSSGSTPPKKEKLEKTR